ncbi:glycoside hydrolase family 97 C-terminal domain-containing protein [Paenibacillus sp. Soil522]|nr:glycoside hydrolase family 97 C-terminal domain-containing protein [Paenibacillus sp. Soil522]
MIEEWFIGCITNEQARERSVKLDFLEEGAAIAYIYAVNLKTRRE